MSYYILIYKKHTPQNEYSPTLVGSRWSTKNADRVEPDYFDKIADAQTVYNFINSDFLKDDGFVAGEWVVTLYSNRTDSAVMSKIVEVL